MDKVTITSWNWRDAASCAEVDGDLWFGPRGEHELTRLRREAKAKAICAACPVRARCLALALDDGPRHGVWGGLNVAELGALRTTAVAA